MPTQVLGSLLRVGSQLPLAGCWLEVYLAFLLFLQGGLQHFAADVFGLKTFAGPEEH